MKIVSVVGARPQFIKAAVVSRAIGKNNERGPAPISETLIHTGQHYDYNMSEVFFEEMGIPHPAVNLNVGSGRHGKVTGEMMAGIEERLIEAAPDMVLVYGDTNSTLAAALAAVKLHVPVAHVEAGLRSFNRAMPEEINRVVTDHVSSLLFCPSESSVELLAKEGITDGVHFVGDVMYDAALYYRERAKPPDMRGPFALCTIHRAENTDDMTRLNGIIEGLRGAGVPILLTLHPRTRSVAEANDIEWPENVVVRDPLSYLHMLGHLEACSFVITDSGGLQKEAYFFGKKCITIRDETEWRELVEAGVNKVAGADSAAIRNAVDWAVSGEQISRKRIYGEGDSGTRIVDILANAR